MNSARRSWIAGVVLGSLMLLASAGASAAGQCGGAVPCRCGDIVTRSVRLSADVGVCTGIGLRIGSGVVLDCANHTITGTTLSPAKYGVLLDSATGTQVKNCRVTGFRKGIRIDGGRANSVTGNETFANHDYGIEVAGGSTDNLISGNHVHDNRDEGIHVGAGADRTVVRQNVVTKNKNENIYVLSSSRCQVVLNTVTRTQSAAIFLKHAQDCYVATNTVVNGPIHVRGASVDNLFDDNDLRGNGYFFEAFQENGVWSYPHDNTVREGQVENTTTCLRFAGAYDNVVSGLALDDECQVTMWPLGGQDPTGNVIHTVPLP